MHHHIIHIHNDLLILLLYMLEPLLLANYHTHVVELMFYYLSYKLMYKLRHFLLYFVRTMNLYLHPSKYMLHKLLIHLHQLLHHLLLIQHHHNISVMYVSFKFSLSYILHLHSATYRNNLSCNIAAQITCKDCCNIGNILWCTASS